VFRESVSNYDSVMRYLQSALPSYLLSGAWSLRQSSENTEGIQRYIGRAVPCLRIDPILDPGGACLVSMITGSW